MALFEDESLNDLDLEDVSDSNCYLDDPHKGISLIKSMLDRYKPLDDLEDFDQIVSEKIFPILAELKLKNELDIYRHLTRISNKIQEQQKIHVLEGKKVVGVGGKFSAGKSCFINSITNADLPEGQRPTTSIATYIVNANEKNNIAISNCNHTVCLNDEAVAALTHQFYEKYKIGFSRLIKNLVIYTPNFTYPNIAILDTPGYSKSDGSKKEDISDAELAREQLKTVDYLIWLVDAVQGVVTQRDLEFIESLNVSTKILVVFTKADCELESNLEQKIIQAKEALSKINKEIYDVIAYNSMDKKTIIGQDSLEKFLSMINEEEFLGDDIVNEIKEISIQLNEQLQSQIDEIEDKITLSEEILASTSNIEHISSIVEEYLKVQIEETMLFEDEKKLQEYLQKLISITEKMRTVN